MITQSIALAAYPAKYENHTGWYGLTVLYLPALLTWLCILQDEGKLRWLFAVWGFYTWLALVPITGINFGLVEDKLDNKAFLGPNVLKMSLSIFPVLLLLLLKTANDSSEYGELVSKVSFQIALDLFDGIEMLEVVLEENELTHGVPKNFEKAIIAFACISFLLPFCQLMEIKFEENGRLEIRKYPAALRIVTQILCVNAVFLGLRWALLLRYGKDASIFIAKNGIVIVFGVLEVWSILRESNRVVPEENPENHSTTELK